MSTFSSLNEEAKSLVSKQDWSNAFLAYTKLITMEGISPSEKAISYSNRSHVLMKMSKYENAKNDALQAINANPKWFKGYMRAGDAFIALNDIENALKSYKEGFGKDGDNGALEKVYTDLFFKHKCPTRMSPNHRYYDKLQQFKDNFFSNYSESISIYNDLTKKRIPQDPDFENI